VLFVFLACRSPIRAVMGLLIYGSAAVGIHAQPSAKVGPELGFKIRAVARSAVLVPNTSEALHWILDPLPQLTLR
jgi:hypothetical protein